MHTQANTNNQSPSSDRPPAFFPDGADDGALTQPNASFSFAYFRFETPAFPALQEIQD
jgi:hypothetical protein